MEVYVLLGNSLPIRNSRVSDIIQNVHFTHLEASFRVNVFKEGYQALKK